MALLKLGSLVSEARGSIGGVVYARNRYGAYARARTKPVDPNTPLQNTYRSNMSQALAAWRALTQAQRALWNAYAAVHTFKNRLGEAFTPSGLNLWTRSFLLVTLIGLEPPTIPQVNMVMEDTDSSVSYRVDPGLYFYSREDTWEALSRASVWWQFNCSNGLNFYKGPYSNRGSRLITDFVAHETELVLDANLLADSSMHCCWRIVTPTGRASTMRYGRAFKPPA